MTLLNHRISQNDPEVFVRFGDLPEDIHLLLRKRYATESHKIFQVRNATDH